MRRLIAATAAALLGGSACTPSHGDESWQDVKGYLLKGGISTLMTTCNQGRKYNSYGVGYWDYKVVENRKNKLLALGRSLERIETVEAGEAAAMREVCPDVK
jgi:hypothetical protein